MLMGVGVGVVVGVDVDLDVGGCECGCGYVCACVCVSVCACEITTNISITRHYRQYFHSTAENTTNKSVSKAQRLSGGVLNPMKD